MARLLSPIASVIRGSVAGLTFTANQFHQIVVRQRTAPVNPNTLNQVHVKGAFSHSASQWLSLTDLQRSDWGDYSDTVNFSGPLGDYTVPGRQLYIGNTSFLHYLNNRGEGPYIVSPTPPVVPGRPAFTKVERVDLAAPGTGFGIKVSNHSGEDIVYSVERSIPFSSTRLRYKGPFVSNTLDSDTVADAGDDTIEFTGLTDGQVYFCRVRGVTAQPQHRMTIEWIIRAEATIVAV